MTLWVLLNYSTRTMCQLENLNQKEVAPELILCHGSPKKWQHVRATIPSLQLVFLGDRLVSNIGCAEQSAVFPTKHQKKNIKYMSLLLNKESNIISYGCIIRLLDCMQCLKGILIYPYPKQQLNLSNVARLSNRPLSHIHSAFTFY